MDILTIFGLFAGSTMLLSYWLEAKSNWMVFVFAIACALSSTYCFLQGAWPFGFVEGIWSIVALQRWVKLIDWHSRRQERRNDNITPGCMYHTSKD